MDELEAYVGFSHCLGIGPVRFQKLLVVFGTAAKAYTSSSVELVEIIGEKTTEKFISFRKAFNASSMLADFRKKGIIVVLKNSETYPKALKDITDAPICLYVKGDMRGIDWNTHTCFGIVGTRKPTEYGRYVAELFSSELTLAGFTVVSGMAYGIDTVAHNACIKLEGKTIAVLGCGVDIPYPYANKNLYDKIIHDGGLVISEFPPGMTVQRGLFIARNRIISGLSKGIMVVEGEKDSGSLVTARYAAEQGRDVFCPPVPLNSSLSEAPNILLRQGAKLVTCVDDILEEYHINKKSNSSSNRVTGTLKGLEKEIYEALKKESLSIDELSLRLNKSVSEVTQTLSFMEINKIVERVDEGIYRRI